MRRALSCIFQELLDSHQSYGVGLIDQNGLLVHSEGGHVGRSSAQFAALLAGLFNARLKQLELSVDESLAEQVVIGRSQSFYLKSLGRTPYLLYSVARKDVLGGSVRAALANAETQLLPLLNGQGLLSPLSERLEQPRQFNNLSLSR